MARIVAPLFGFRASGSIAKTITYATWKGINYAKGYKVPANPRTESQIMNRNDWKSLVTFWHTGWFDGRIIIEQQAYNRLASFEYRQMTGFNAFMHIYKPISILQRGFATKMRLIRNLTTNRCQVEFYYKGTYSAFVVHVWNTDWTLRQILIGHIDDDTLLSETFPLYYGDETYADVIFREDLTGNIRGRSGIAIYETIGP